MVHELNKYSDSDSDNMNLGDLWSHLAQLTHHIDKDNNAIRATHEVYPISLRKIQLSSVSALIKEIEKIHQLIE